MTKPKSKAEFKTSWGGWQPEPAKAHEVSVVLRFSTPYDRLKWLAVTLEGLERIRKSVVSKQCL